MRKGQIDIRVLGVGVEKIYIPELALRRSLDLIATMYEEIEESPSTMLCKTYDDIQRAKKEGKVGFILDLEGADPLGADIQLLRIFYSLGLRLLGFSHSFRNYLADGAFYLPKETGQEGGLTDVGLAFLEKAQAMGIMIDVSHLNDPGFWDVIKFSKAPIIASHSNCRALRNHPRNLTDDQIKAIAETDGVIGMNACRLYVEQEDLNHLLGHIDHLAKVVGIKYIGLGPDFADYIFPYTSEAEKANYPLEGIRPIKGLAGDEEFPKIVDGLAKRGYSPNEIDLIMGENFVRVFKTVLLN
jgi:membrane dipeptidase